MTCARPAFLASRICVMSARPGRIIDDSHVAFARPRTIAMTFEPDFVALNQRLREFIVDARTASATGSGLTCPISIIAKRPGRRD